MAYVRTVPPGEASTQALSLRPAAIAAYRRLIGAIRDHQDARRYELITTFAASRLRCRY